MNPLEFETGLGTLYQNYGSDDKKVEYTHEQKDILWNEFRTLNAIAWGNVIARLIRTYSYLPKTSQFYFALQEIEKEEGGGKIDRDIRRVDEECPRCNRLGLLWGIFKDPETGELRTAVAKCSCRNSENWSKKIPTAADVERNENSGLIEWAGPGRIDTTMDALKEYHGEPGPTVVEKEVPDDEIPF